MRALASDKDKGSDEVGLVFRSRLGFQKSAWFSGWNTKVAYSFGRRGDVQTFSHSSDWLGTFVRLFLVPLLIEVA